jgi:hypothetical protein
MIYSSILSKIESDDFDGEGNGQLGVKREYRGAEGNVPYSQLMVEFGRQ